MLCSTGILGLHSYRLSEDSLARFTDIEADQDVVNTHQGEWFGGHIPTSTTLEISRLATDPRLRFEFHVVAAAPA